MRPSFLFVSASLIAWLAATSALVTPAQAEPVRVTKKALERQKATEAALKEQTTARPAVALPAAATANAATNTTANTASETPIAAANPAPAAAPTTRTTTPRASALAATSPSASAPLSSNAAASGRSGVTDYLTPYVGAFNILEHTGTDIEGQFGLEYRAKPFYSYTPWNLDIRPIAGFNVMDTGGAYGYFGLDFDFALTEHWLIIPNFSAGLYSQGDDDDSLDQGGAIEFRSGIELGYQFDNQQRIGVAFNHVSNASIYDRNPGSETVLISYSLPLNWFR